MKILVIYSNIRILKSSLFQTVFPIKKFYQSWKKLRRLTKYTPLKKLKKYALYQAQTLRLMGDYQWLIGKQRNAFKWWDKAIKKGEELGARPDLSRIYCEVGKALLDPKCKYKEWNGMTAQEYLSKARDMFEDMDLQYDLDELDKIVAAPPENLAVTDVDVQTASVS